MSDARPIALGRDGHLTEAALNAFMLDDPGTPLHFEATRHVAKCPVCRAEVAAVRAFDASLQLRPSRAVQEAARAHAQPSASGPEAESEGADAVAHLTPAEAAPDRTRGRHLVSRAGRPVPAAGRTRQIEGRRGAQRWWPAMGGLLAAALALLVLRPLATPDPDGPDVLRGKGGALDVELYAHDGKEVRRLDQNDTVGVGERLGFRLQLHRAGHVMIVGVDQQGHTYLCYPQQGGGRSRAHAVTSEPVTLPQAMRFDDVLGYERVLVIHCPHPFGLEEFEPELRTQARSLTPRDTMPQLIEGCAQRETVLEKTTGAGGDVRGR